MAMFGKGSIKVLFVLSLMSSLYFIPVLSVEFEVGDDKGWVIPPANNTDLYNSWASKNRFKVNDSLRFKYKSDSVMEVTDNEYNNCKSTHPIFFANNGDSVYLINRPGLLYFISGVDGHCEKGMKMIIKVLEPKTPPQPSPPSSAGYSVKRGALEIASVLNYLILAMPLLAHFV